MEILTMKMFYADFFSGVKYGFDLFFLSLCLVNLFFLICR